MRLTALALALELGVASAPQGPADDEAEVQPEDVGVEDAEDLDEPEDLEDLEDLDEPEDLDDLDDPDDLDDLEDLDEPEDLDESEPEAPTPSVKKTCRREDFANFDDFVDCQVAQNPVNRPSEVAAPTRVEPERAPLLSQKDEEIAEWKEYQEQMRRVKIGLLVSGVAAVTAGTVLIIVAFDRGKDGGETDDSFRGSPNCTVGKLCGDTCIEATDTCHVGGGGGGGGSSFKEPHPGLVWSGVAVLAAGVGLASGGLVAWVRESEAKSTVRSLKWSLTRVTVRF